MYGVMWHKIKKTDYKNIIIIASGPSLCNFNFDILKNIQSSFIITINDAGRYVNFANMWFTIDPWGIHQGGKQIPPNINAELCAAVPEDYGTPTARFHDHRNIPNPKVKYLRRLQFHTCSNIPAEEYQKWGFSDDNTCIHTGNSAYGALNLAYHMHPKRVLLLGVDGTSGYFYNTGKPTRSLNYLPTMFKSAIPQLISRNIEVINGSPNSQITCFSRHTIPDAIEFLQTS